MKNLYNGLTLDQYARKHYHTRMASDDEFYDDLNRIKNVKRSTNKYINTGFVSIQLLTNHVITICNVFGVYGGVTILQSELTVEQRSVIKPILQYLQYVVGSDWDDVPTNNNMIKRVKEGLR